MNATSAERRKARPVPAPTPVRRARLVNAVAPYLFVLPFLISFLVFLAGPSVYSFVLSFFEYKGYGTADFVGLGNYRALLSDPTFWSSVANTGFYWLGSVLPLMVGAFVLALLTHSKLVRWRRFYQLTIFMPQVMAPVAAALVWQVIFSTRTGVINSLLQVEIPWLTDPLLMKISVTVLLLWRATGWYYIVFLAGLSSIRQDVLEAAEVDGANALRRTIHVTIPMMRPIFLFAFVVNTVTSVQVFSEPQVLLSADSLTSMPTAGAPVMGKLVEQIGNGGFGLGSAVGWLLFLLIGALSTIQLRLLRERG